MTTDLEKQFFDTFGIEQKKYTQCCSMGCKKPNEECGNCEYHEVYKVDYPQITDRHYLELISELSGVTKPHFVFERGVEELKYDILKQCIFFNKELEHQVRTLFEEG